jgi:glycosyltransferase involved in cell wall biosynthesis
MGDHEGLGLGFYESLACGTLVFTIDTPPNNEIIREGINGWVVRCNYVPLTDNNQGIVYKACVEIEDLKNKLLDIINHYQRENMYHSTVADYICRYPIGTYAEQLQKIFD